jgi:hypothetical protein
MVHITHHFSLFSLFVCNPVSLGPLPHQVTVEYKNEGGAMVPLRVHTVVISTQHDETVTNEQVQIFSPDFSEHFCRFFFLSNMMRFYIRAGCCVAPDRPRTMAENNSF